LIKRVITGSLLVGLLLIITTFHNFWLIWSFLGLIYLISIYEVKKLYKLSPNINYFILTLLTWLLSATMNHPINLALIFFVIFLGIIAYKPDFKREIFFPYFYPTIPLLAIWELYKTNENFTQLGWLIVIVALTDTMAYFVGKGIGKRQFSKTSPNKSIEGVLGGLFFGTIGGVILGSVLFIDFNIIQLLLFSFLISLSSIYGDLFESFLKRQAGVKDSGNLLPGHGGILDRLDGYLLSAPLLLVLFQW
jgi:phosphatidate cytidylyltransferase